MSHHKKLIEVALPLEVINIESARENRFDMDILVHCIYGGRDDR
jgi:hypothetical protein